MNRTDLTAVHAAELDMMKAVTALCDRHGIRYTIYCGTLLGAVRHRGFIPWDDDADLAMPLADYRRFLAVSGELPPRYVCVHGGNTRAYPFLWVKVFAEGTTAMPVRSAPLDIPWGLSIDIYPFIGEAKSRAGRLLQRAAIRFARILRQAPLYRARRVRGPAHRLVAALPLALTRALSRAALAAAMRDPEGCARVGTIDAAPFRGKYPAGAWREMIRLPFEDAEFSAPACYDGILRTMYGDYMRLPPEEKRRGHCGEEDCILDAGRDYRAYRKEMLGK